MLRNVQIQGSKVELKIEDLVQTAAWRRWTLTWSQTLWAHIQVSVLAHIYDGVKAPALAILPCQHGEASQP